MERISAGRALMGDSLAFHLIFVIFGVALPLLISGTELYGIIRHRPRARALARTWSKALVILFIAGAASGTIISLQFSLLWPNFMEFISKTVGVAFALEGTAFLIEALFLSVYMLSWDRFSAWGHWLCSVPLFLSSMISAVFITSVNAFMNQPVGFVLGQNGQPTNINTWRAITNPALFTEVTHSVAAYICTVAFVFAAVYAWLYMKKHHSHDRTWMRQVITALLIIGLIFGAITGFLGDRSGKYLARYEPYKLAAAEVLETTTGHAPLIVGGVLVNNQLRYGLKVPSMLSFLAYNNASAEVQGLDRVAPQDRPPLYIHYFFDGMVGIGMLTVAVPVLYLLLYKLRRRWALSRLMLALVVLMGPAAVLATEFGWMLTELGRQPYVIYGYLKTADALTANPQVIQLAIFFPLFFITLIILTIVVLRRTMNHKAVHNAR